MGWKETVKEIGGGLFTFLSTDGEALTFIVVGDPVVMTSTYKQKEQVRVGCPVVTDEGFILLIAGKRLTRKLSKHEDSFKKCAFTAVRHGAENDTNTVYELIKHDDAETFKRLKAIADKDFKPGMIKEAVDEANEVMNS